MNVIRYLRGRVIIKILSNVEICNQIYEFYETTHFLRQVNRAITLVHSERIGISFWRAGSVIQTKLKCMSNIPERSKLHKPAERGGFLNEKAVRFLVGNKFTYAPRTVVQAWMPPSVISALWLDTVVSSTVSWTSFVDMGARVKR